MRIERSRRNSFAVFFGADPDADLREVPAESAHLCIDRDHLPYGIELVSTFEFLRIKNGVVVRPPTAIALAEDAQLVAWDPLAKCMMIRLVSRSQIALPAYSRQVLPLLFVGPDDVLCGVEVAVAHWEVERIMERARGTG